MAISTRSLGAISGLKHRILSHRAPPRVHVRHMAGLSAQYAIDPSPLAGTAPEHMFHLILQTSHPPHTWPAKLQDASPLLRDISALLKPHGGLVNFAWAPSETEKHPPTESWQETSSSKLESYRGTLYSPHKEPYTIPSISQTSLPELSSIVPRSSSFFGAPLVRIRPPVIDVYVCTHGARDCRCGDIGGEIVQALRGRVVDRPGVRVFDIGHVGGHKWAGNVLVFPSGDWYGNLRPEDVPAFLDHITSHDRYEPMWSHWRGRMGLSKDVQAGLHHAATVGHPAETAERSTHAIKFVSWNGEETTLQASEGQNLMELARDANLPGIEGICDGNLECATCQMYIDPSAPLARMSDAEDDMLAYAIGRKDEESRLGCQIDVTPELAAWITQGGRIRLPRF